MTLCEKLHKIYESVDHIDKFGENKSQKYFFLRSADVVRAIREQLIEQRVYAEINFDFVGEPFNIPREKAPNAPFIAVRVRCWVVFHDLDSADVITSSGLGEGCDNNDKAAGKAQTNALKYAIKNAFLVPDEADPEADESVDRGTRTDADETQSAAPQKARAVARPTSAPASTQAEASKSKPSTTTASTSKNSATSVSDAVVPSTPSATVPVAGREPGDEPDDAPPTEEQMNGENGFHAQFVALRDELKGKLLPSKNPSIPVNRKLLVFLLSVTGVDNAAKISTFQWEDFFRRVDAVRQSAHGLPGLVVLINRANGVETK